MLQYLRLILFFVICFIVISIIDAFWHLLIFGKIYLKELKPVLNRQNGEIIVRNIAAFFSQVLVVLSIIFLILYKRDNTTAADGTIIGSAAGTLAITVYGLVNFALIKNWSPVVTVLEIIWGPIIGGLSGFFIVWLKNKLF